MLSTKENTLTWFVTYGDSVKLCTTNGCRVCNAFSVHLRFFLVSITGEANFDWEDKSPRFAS